MKLVSLYFVKHAEETMEQEPPTTTNEYLFQIITKNCYKTLDHQNSYSRQQNKEISTPRGF